MMGYALPARQLPTVGSVVPDEVRDDIFEYLHDAQAAESVLEDVALYDGNADFLYGHATLFADGYINVDRAQSASGLSTHVAHELWHQVKELKDEHANIQTHDQQTYVDLAVEEEAGANAFAWLVHLQVTVARAGTLVEEEPPPYFDRFCDYIRRNDYWAVANRDWDRMLELGTELATDLVERGRLRPLGMQGWTYRQLYAQQWQNVRSQANAAQYSTPSQGMYASASRMRNIDLDSSDAGSSQGNSPQRLGATSSRNGPVSPAARPASR